jgi:CDP-diacylglycerol--serine O-phosphatidyltransferase
LSDLVVFGVVPALCLYIWALQDAGTMAWWATLFYAVSIALRLARFDSELPDPPDYAKGYFTGIPAPASGFLVLMPIVIDLQFNLEIARDPNWVSAWLVLVGAGAVSALPTFAGKRVKLPVGSVLPVLAGIGLLGAAVVTEPWFTYMAVVVIYALSLPLSTLQFLRERRQYEGSKSS